MKHEGDIAAVLDGEADWCVVTGLAGDVCSAIPESSIDVVCSDPPYSKHVHQGVRSSARNTAPDVAEFECRTRRQVDLHFEYLTAKDRRRLAAEMARICRFWNLVFSDTESAWLWKMSLQARGMDYVRTAFWDRIGGAPSFHGNYPAPAFEAITITRNRNRRWNGGGKRAHYTHPIVANRAGARGERMNEAQKPESLMVEIGEDYFKLGDLVADLTCGAGTTGVAALKLGCRFIGIEMRPEMAETARERLRAVAAGTTLRAVHLGQTTMFA